VYEIWVAKERQPLVGTISQILTFDVAVAAKKVITFMITAVPAVVSVNRQRGGSIPGGSAACGHQMGLKNSSIKNQ
jgi:hypothetical protein